jgi:hypothetical protein
MGTWGGSCAEEGEGRHSAEGRERGADRSSVRKVAVRD